MLVFIILNWSIGAAVISTTSNQAASSNDLQADPADASSVLQVPNTISEETTTFDLHPTMPTFKSHPTSKAPPAQLQQADNGQGLVENGPPSYSSLYTKA